MIYPSDMEKRNIHISVKLMDCDCPFRIGQFNIYHTTDVHDFTLFKVREYIKNRIELGLIDDTWKQRMQTITVYDINNNFNVIAEYERKN